MTGGKTLDPDASQAVVRRFLESGAANPTLGLVYGRRRVGKSTLLHRVAEEEGGFYWEATRGETAVQLDRLGTELGRHLGVGRLSIASWEEGLARLLDLGADGPVPVVVDEFGYLLESDSSIDSLVASALGPAGRKRHGGRARLILCGSAIAMMRALASGEAPLRGRAGMELVMTPFGFRAAADHLESGAPRELALRVYAVVGGVIGYMTDMVDHDLPDSLEDFDRWVAERVLSPAATLHHEATTLLAEDPTLSAASPTIHHSILGAIANGSVTAGKIANRLRRSVSSLDPSLKRLISAGFVLRHEDPLRARRPTYALADPFLQFHYAVLEPHGVLLRDRDPGAAWEELSGSFGPLVRGPVFEEQAREWVRRHAAPETLGGSPDRIGPSTVVSRGRHFELDVVAARGERILAIAEAKAGATVGTETLRGLHHARAELGAPAADAKLLLIAPTFTREIVREAAGRTDLELIDLDRLYEGT